MRISELDDVPKQVREVLLKEGITTLYPPQEKAIKLGVLDGVNMVLASPTASGKTLVAELCALKKVLSGEGKVLYLTPLRALASEKFKEFAKYTQLTKRSGAKVRVAISTGDYDSSDPWLSRYDVIVTTNEKADSLLRHGARWMDRVSLIVADEIHLLNSADRGAALEVVLARLMQRNPNAQILALSATVKNADEVAAWIKGRVISTNWRPVKLLEGVLHANTLLFNDGSSMRIKELHSNPSIGIALNVIREGGQALIFAETRKRAISLAKTAATPLEKLLGKREKLLLGKVAKRVLSIGEVTRVSELLADLISKGSAFHHAGLHPSHRGIVEDEFRRGRIKLIAATPTLAAGVNLPARVVIIHSYERYEPGYGRVPISVLEYKQMAGRAGRPKYDNVGEAILLAKSLDEQDYLMETYVCAEPERIWSKLGSERALRSHVLSTIASGLAYSEAGLMEFFDKTFFAFQYGVKNLQRIIGKVLKLLFNYDLVRIDRGFLTATKFGKRVSELYLDPQSAITIRKGLLKNKEATDVALLHLVCHTPDMGVLAYPRRREMNLLQSYLEAHAEELFFEPPTEWRDPVGYEVFLSEMKMVKILEDWINEALEDALIERYGVEPGDLYRLIANADWLLYSTCELAKLFDKIRILSRAALLRERVLHGVKAELVPLARLKGVGRIRARALYNAGLKRVADLKRASLADLARVPTIGPRLARRIKEQVGGLVRPEEWKRPEKKVLGQKKLIELR
jgi:helicase